MLTLKKKRNTGGLMRPDHVPNKGNNNHATKINRFLNNASDSNGALTTSANQNKQETAKNFHKTLRKAPKGIYLNVDELVSLAESGDNDEIFDGLNRRLLFLKKEVY